MQIFTPDTCTRFEDLSLALQQKLISTIAEEEGCTDGFFAPPFTLFADELIAVLKCCESPNGQYLALRGIIRRLYALAEKYPWNNKYEMLQDFFDQMDAEGLAYDAIERIIYEGYDDDDF